MAFDQQGRVIINPRVPLGLPEFAALYTGEGLDPIAAASNIHLNYPMEAKSLMDKNWRALGINQPPERYFATRAKQAMPVAPSPAMQPVDPMATAWPTFNSVAERDIAIASGAFDPAYASPLQKAHVLALEATDKKDREAIRARAKEVMPVGLNPNLNAQLAGDTTGLVKRILVKNSGITMDQYMNQASGNPDSMLAAVMGKGVPNLRAYQPKGGFGPLVGRDIPNRLDMDIISNPDFEEVMASDPAAAKYAYERLTGRSYDGDLNEAVDTRKNQLAIGRKYTERALQQGAYRDPVTGKWKVWNMQEAEPSIGLGSTRAGLGFIDASEPQTKWLNTHYESVMNQPLTDPTPQDQAYRQSIYKTMEHDPEFQAQVDAKEQEIGGSLTNEELAMLAKLKLKKANVPNWWGQGATNTIEGLLRGATLPMNKDVLGPLAIPTDQDVMNMLRSLGGILPTPPLATERSILDKY